MKMRKRRSMPKVVSFDDFRHWKSPNTKITFVWGVGLRVVTEHCKLVWRCKDTIVWRKK